jgi:hypothetical protein
MICWLISVSNPNLGKIHAFLENNLDVIFIIQISFKPIECYFLDFKTTYNHDKKQNIIRGCGFCVFWSIE